MDFWDLSKLLFRRWYFAVPMLALTVAATVLVGKTVKPDYHVTSYVQLIPPTAAVDDQPTTVTKKDNTPRNPWLELGLNSLSHAGMLTLQDKTVLKQLLAEGLSDNVVVTVDQQAPVLTIEVVGHTPEQATQTTTEVYKRLTLSVQTLQADYGAKRESFITVRRLDRGDNIEEANAKVKRALVAVGGVGVLLTVGLTIALDALILRRRNRPARRSDKPTGSDAPSGTELPLGTVAAVGNGFGYTTQAAAGARPEANLANQSARRQPTTEPADARAGHGERAVPADRIVPADRVVPGERTVVIDQPLPEDVTATIVLPTRSAGGMPTAGP